MSNALARAASSTFPTYFKPRTLMSLTGPVAIPVEGQLTHLQLRRFAGCPICNLHLRSFAKRYLELRAAGVAEIVVFHSSLSDLELVHTEQPFPIVADPERRLYEELGVGSSPRAVADPRAWGAAAKAIAKGAAAHATVGAGDGSTGLPGDFLLTPNGEIVADHRGVHADDQWSVDELLSVVRKHRSEP